MTKDQKWVIDQKDENGLRESISILTATHHKDKAELIAYCEERLELIHKMNPVNAMVEQTDMSDMGGE